MKTTKKLIKKKPSSVTSFNLEDKLKALEIHFARMSKLIDKGNSKRWDIPIDLEP